MKNFNFYIKTLMCVFLLISCEDSEINRQDVVKVIEVDKGPKKPPVLPQELHYRLWSEPLVVPVYLHVFQFDGTPTDNDVAIASQTLIDDYAIQGIEICIAEINIYLERLEYYMAPPYHVDGYLNISLADSRRQGGGNSGSLDGVPDDGTGLGGTTDDTYRLHDKTIVHEIGHCFGLSHYQPFNLNNVMSVFPSFISTDSLTQFTENQRDYMQNIIRTEDIHNKWHEYLNFIDEEIILGDTNTATFDWQTTNPNYSANIQVTDWSVSPNLTINQINGDSMTFSTAGNCYGTTWVNANIQISECVNISVCKQISIVSAPGDKLPENFVNYICGSTLVECDFQNYEGDCDCPVVY